ncbi:alpha/beta fold hydrolase [Congregibacter litoralis]|uniref:Homoserine acetyltransferase n=1 Tax=Congregibacter litoralis KT71 TaxID=314285 RepID=A4A436_9GAMM|nr:alpha/beta fold hydrolase [Congregibacter litoralis]EAQ99459.2 Homoserine acetyltransferase [Congregibacter litoralis KT71]
MTLFYKALRQRRLSALGIAFGLMVSFPGAAYEPSPVEGHFTIDEFVYEDGSAEPLTQHYRTLGTPRRNAEGRVTNAVLIMHGTTGSGAGFLRDRFAGVLFAPGGILDAERYFIVLTDAIGHGQSSKPSTGSAGDFPNYSYNDLVRAQYRLLTEHLGINHLRLVTGTSMGGMLSWIWGYEHPDFMDAIMPLASLPVEIAGRNRMLRKMIIDGVKNDPDYQNGFYTTQPAGLREALYPLIFMVSSPLQYQKLAPTRRDAEAMLNAALNRYSAAMDANDLIYAFDASRDYNPAPHLEGIKAPLLAINSADDQVNPPELMLLEEHIERVPRGEAVTLDISSLTRGHGTHSLPGIWGPYLARFLKATGGDESEPPRDYSALSNPDAPVWSSRAPEHFTARFDTTEGRFSIAVTRDLAPLGADRFYQLVSAGYYDGVHINRVVPGFIAQFGVHGRPAIQEIWKTQMIPDDEVLSSNLRGSVAFAMTGPDTRSTQVFINTVDNARLDQGGFAPFGTVLEGMDVVDRLYGLYGEEAGGGLRGGQQGPLESGGSEYLNSNYPLLDFIRRATIPQDS